MTITTNIIVSMIMTMHTPRLMGDGNGNLNDNQNEKKNENET